MTRTGRPASASQLADATTQELAQAQRAIVLSPLASRLRSLEAWRTFMRLHVFAVWDFMSLLKRLQRELTCTAVPWLPGAHGPSARLINDIVMAEESDVDGQGGFCSHFELYRRGMAEAGADGAPIDDFLAALRRGRPVALALAATPLPAAVRDFVQHTLEVASQGTLVQVAATFLYGREAVLPHLFVDLLAVLQEAQVPLGTLAYYFKRHIEVDGDTHGPMARELLMALCGTDERKWREAQDSAARSLALRAALWHAIEADITRG